MSPIELIKKAENSSALLFHKFILLKTKTKNELFCFYEGKDGPYYHPRIQNIVGNHHPITCANKKGVIEVHKIINNKYKNSKTSFFIDSDYDKKQNTQNLYETPCYSIENLYTSKKVLESILKNEFLLTEIDTEFDLIIKLFEENQKLFHDSILLFNSWYATAKNKANTKNVSTEINLNEKPPKEFIIVKIGAIKSNYDFDKILEKFPNSIEVTETEVNKTKIIFDNSEKAKIFRGKYEIEFMYQFLQFIIEDANVNKNILKKKTTFKVERAQIISQLSQYAETPNCLDEYLKEKK
jgi:hypothetical protein